MDLRQTMRMLQTRMEREAKEFPTEEARKRYLEEHPQADPKKHTVQEKDEKAEDERAKGKTRKGPADTEDIPVESPEGGEKMLEKRKPKPPTKPEDLPEEHREALKDYKLEIVGDDAQQAVEIAQKVKKGIEDAADVCKLSPPVCVGNKGLSRDKMPQIEGGKSVKEMLQSDDELERKKGQAMVQAGADPDDDRPVMKQLLTYLEAQGAGSKQARVRVGELKATQKEIKAAKTFGIADAHLKGKFDALTEEPKVMISKDGYILDGHHRWAAVLTIDPKRTMEVVQIDMNMDELLHEAASFPGVYKADFAGEPLSEDEQKEYKKKHDTKLSKGKHEKMASLQVDLLRLAYDYPEHREKLLTLVGAPDWPIEKLAAARSPRLLSKTNPATVAQVLGIVRRSGVPVGKGRGRIRDQRSGVTVSKMQPGRIGVFGMAEDIARLAPMFLREGYMIFAPIAKRWIGPGDQVTKRDTQGGTLVVARPQKDA